MDRIVFFIILSLLLISSSTHLQSNEEGFISLLISSKGLEFAKEILTEKAVSSMIPLQLPEIEKSVKVPVVGRVHMLLSDITIYRVDIASSYVETGDTGIVLVVSGATANLSMSWAYSYRTWIGHIAISDDGDASVQVEGMFIVIAASLKYQSGTLELSLKDCATHVKDISIKMDGGASWLYQGVVDAFHGKIVSAIENAVSKKIREGIIKLNSLLQNLPKEIKINDVLTLNVTFLDDPILSKSSVELKINGLLIRTDQVSVSEYNHKETQNSTSLNGPPRMVEVSLQENVLNSAALVYFNANHMHWIADKIPGQSILKLNTAEWRFIIPQLYKQYPNDEMDLNISVAAPPIILVEEKGIDATIHLDVIIDVLDNGVIVPVACISSVINASCSANFLRNNLAASIKLVDFTSSLKWSKIGGLHMHIVQSLMKTIIKRFFFPYVNLRLRRGFHLPFPHGFTLQNAEILCFNSRVTICGNIASTERYDAPIRKYMNGETTINF